jgi:predicted ABC-type ATPase
LPIFQKLSELKNFIEMKKMGIINGSFGCGKTLVIPSLVLDSFQDKIQKVDQSEYFKKCMESETGEIETNLKFIKRNLHFISSHSINYYTISKK